MTDILGGGRFERAAPIDKGFSGDKKYCVTAFDGERYLLRVVPMEKYDVWQKLFETLKRVAALGIPMSAPVELGICPEGAYVLSTWIDGVDLETVLPGLPESTQYELGVKAGKILRTINSIPAQESEEDWGVKCNRSIEGAIKRYREDKINQIDGSGHLLRYIAENRHLIENRPQCFLHGDYSIPNMMLEGGGLRIIDFDRYKFGDPWSEFSKTVFSARLSPVFTSGQLHGYFGGEPPLDFFRLMALYTSYPFIRSVSWAVPHGQEEVDFVIGLYIKVLKWFDNMDNPVPLWYSRP